MAENNTSNTNNSSAQMKYFRTHIAGLTVVTGTVTAEDAEKGNVAPPSVRFQAYEEKRQGDKVVVGYLATDNLVAIKKLAKDGNVESISEKEYNDATDEEKGAKRAAV